MAADAVTFVLDKLTTLLEEKLNMVNEVKQEVEYIRDELERMIAFLRVADAAEDDDPELKVWIKQVRDVAYETEDIIDDFVIQIHRKNNCRWGGFCDYLGVLVCSVRNLKTRYETASEIQSIKSRITEIAEGHRRYRYKFNVPGEGSASGLGSIHGIDSRVDALLLEESELVGTEKPTRQIIPWLVEGDARLKVVSVVGMGGLGKTTLVKKVYDDSVVKKHFQNHAWITVSQSFEVEELLKDMIQQLFHQMKISPPKNLSTMNGSMPHLEKLIVQRCNFLEVVPEGIECLANMKVLEFFDMPIEFILPLSLGNLGTEYWKIAHIPEVYHTYWRNDCWEVHPLDKKETTEKSGQTAIVRTQEQRNWL
ncbi:putative disease resistance protein [Forsythia ovata]|uniref:Disease resistance protein n=1 Tax=Forsythia ovata TaxID=205694 RepID=A0ABD1TNG6_9LAMI